MALLTDECTASTRVIWTWSKICYTTSMPNYFARSRIRSLATIRSTYTWFVHYHPWIFARRHFTWRQFDANSRLAIPSLGHDCRAISLLPLFCLSSPYLMSKARFKRLVILWFEMSRGEGLLNPRRDIHETNSLRSTAYGSNGSRAWFGWAEYRPCVRITF